MDYKKEEFYFREGSYLGKYSNCTLMSASDVTQVKYSSVGLPVNWEYQCMWQNFLKLLPYHAIAVWIHKAHFCICLDMNTNSITTWIISLTTPTPLCHAKYPSTTCSIEFKVNGQGKNFDRGICRMVNHRKMEFLTAISMIKEAMPNEFQVHRYAKT